MLRLYNALLLPLRAVAPVWAAIVSRDPDSARGWEERLGWRLPTAAPGGVWVHGASVGEARLVRSLAAEVRRVSPALPIYASALTATGRSQIPAPPAVDAAFLAPLDFAGLPGRVLDALRPVLVVLVETEIWPNLLVEAAARRVPVAIVNARLAPERMARYHRFRGLFGPLLAGLSRVGAQSEVEARRFVELGVPKEAVEVTGNVKYDLPAPPASAASLRLRFGLAADRRVVAAGSTGAGEEALVLDAFLEARRDCPSLFLILAPRHPDRAAEGEAEAARRGVRLHRLSRRADAEAGGADGLLVDTVGELSGLYALADAAFVGGSLVPIGGHNLLEPAAAGVPVLFGPHVHHVREVADALERAGAGRPVRDAAGLAEEWRRLVTSPEARERMGRAAGEVVRASRGALERTVALILFCARWS